MNDPSHYRVTKEQYAEFLKHYAWQLLKSSDYRLGQAFLNYFNEVDKIMEADRNQGRRDAVLLYYETDNKRAQEVIDRWREL